MITDVFLFSKKPFDVGMLLQAYRDLGPITMLETVLRFGTDRDRLEFDFEQDESLWVDLDDPDKTKDRILAAIGKPFVTRIDYKGKVMATLVMSRLPSMNDIFAYNNNGLLITLDEVQQRIKLGVEWLMRGGEWASADLVINHPGEVVPHAGGGAIVILDNGRMAAQQRVAVLKQKLASFMKYLPSLSFAANHYELDRHKLVAEVVSTAPPTPGMRAITSASDPAHPEFLLPVEYVTEAEFRERHDFVPRDLPSLRDRY